MTNVGPPPAVSLGLALLGKFGGPVAPFARAASFLLTNFATFGTHGHRGQQRLVYAGIDPMVAAQVAVWARQSFGPIAGGQIIGMVADQAERARPPTAGPGCTWTMRFRLRRSGRDCSPGAGSRAQRSRAFLSDAWFAYLMGDLAGARRAYRDSLRVVGRN